MRLTSVVAMVAALCALGPVHGAFAAAPGTNGRVFLSGGAGGSDAGNSVSNLYSMVPDGSDLEQITRDDGSHAPAVSPNGRRIVFVCGGFVPRRSEICVMKVDGSDRQRLTRNRTFDGDPSWSQDGSRILFKRVIETANKAEIFTMSPRGKGVRRVTHNEIDEVDPVGKPTADRIAYVRLHGSNEGPLFDVFTIGPRGEDRRRITKSKALEQHLDWHPKGNRLVFVRNGNLFIKRVGAKGTTRLTAGPADDIEPVWSPDGRFVGFHRTGRGDHRTGLMQIDVATKEKELLLAEPVSEEGECEPNLCFYTDPSWQPLN